jgi:hypothetical protein
MGGAYGTQGKKKNVYRVLVEKLCEAELFEDLAFDGQILLRCIF